MQIIELRCNVKAWKVKYMYVTSDEWDFGEGIAEVLKDSTPRPRVVLNEMEMSLRSTFERFWSGGAPLWFQVISLRTVEENDIVTIPHPRMDQILAKLQAIYGSTGSEILEETEAHKRLLDQQQQQQQQQQQHQPNPDSSGAFGQASPPPQRSGEVPFEEVVRIVDVLQYCEQPQPK
ncbi:hypothetical protein Dimus_013620 [Dionaea muscipula]